MLYNGGMQPTLYLLVGYPGAGKTFVAKIITAYTGGVHLWADRERHNMFAEPSHSQAENKQLYDHLNTLTGQLLSEGKTVIFDANFNFYADREHLRQIASDNHAHCQVVWVTTPLAIARQRAVYDRQLRNGYEFTLPGEAFDRMSTRLEPPTEAEQPIKLDGTDLNDGAITQALGISK